VPAVPRSKQTDYLYHLIKNTGPNDCDRCWGSSGTWCKPCAPLHDSMQPSRPPAAGQPFGLELSTGDTQANLAAGYWALLSSSSYPDRQESNDLNMRVKYPS
jgi:hypothetical protein